MICATWMKRIQSKAVLIAALSFSTQLHVAGAESAADINLNIKHIVGGVSQFDRQKFMTVHSNLSEPDWVGEDEKLDYLLNDLDVYMGRDNGNMLMYVGEADEDPNRPGYVDPAYVTVSGKIDRRVIYGSKHANRHKHDHRNDVMIGGQPSVFWPGKNTRRDGTGWRLDGADAIGEFMGRYLNAFYRQEGESPKDGPSRPRWLEVVNEPLYELIDGHKGSTVLPQEVFAFHNEVARSIRKVNDTVLIGGYTAAFPIFEERGFARWNERMKLFVDSCGNQLDFFSVHFYDFNTRGRNGRDYFKGGRLEATFDMMEQYSQLRLGQVKPFIVSEYGGRDHSLERGQWSAYRDWHFMKAFSPLLLSFMDRPDLVLKAIPFITAKAEWGAVDGRPYNWRLLRQAKEGVGEEGDEWVFTEQIKFYELWSDVNGTRVDSTCTNPDVLIDGYVDGRKAYVILSNLNDRKETVHLNMLGEQLPSLESVSVKHLHLVGDAPELDIREQNKPLSSFTLDHEATAIIEYTFSSDIRMDQTAVEQKYYATDYNKPIDANQAVRFELNGVKGSAVGSSVLRIGFGREKERSRRPGVQFNHVALDVPVNYRGDEQSQRPAFFGLLEIPVPRELVRTNNEVEITFPDSGGRVSSVTLRAFEYSSTVAPGDGVL